MNNRKILPFELEKRLETVRKRVAERISPHSPPSAPLQIGGGALLDRGRARINTIVNKAKAARPGVIQRGAKRLESWQPGARISKPSTQVKSPAVPKAVSPSGEGEAGF